MAEEVEVIDATGTDMVLYDTNLFPDLKWADPEDAGKRFAERFGRAKTADDLFDVLEGNNTQHMVGKTIEIQDVQFQAFMSDRGVIPNAICLVADVKTGELSEMATTSEFCTMFLRKAQLLELLPLRVKVVEKVTKGGNKAINFERP